MFSVRDEMVHSVFIISLYTALCNTYCSYILQLLYCGLNGIFFCS